MPRRDEEMRTAFGNDTNASSRIRRRGCYFGASGANEELEGERIQWRGKEKAE